MDLSELYSKLHGEAQDALSKGAHPKEVYRDLQAHLSGAEPDDVTDTILEVLDCLSSWAPVAHRFKMTPRQQWQWHEVWCQNCNTPIPCPWLGCKEGERLHWQWAETVAWP